MLKTINEKDRVTFVYSEQTMPIVIALVGVLGLGAGVSVIGSVTLYTLIALLLGPSVAFLVTYVMLKQKQILLIDGSRNTVEEHFGKKRIVFNFTEVEFADVERVREEESAVPDEPSKDKQEILQEGHDVTQAVPQIVPTSETHAKTTKLHLNYHPYLLLKKDNEKYFFLDNKERGLPNYKTAKLVVETINQYIGVAKLVTENLNLYKIEKKSNKGVLGLLLILILLGIGLYFIFRFNFL